MGIVATSATVWTLVEQMRRLTDALPNAELVVFQHSGHFPFMEESAAYLATVRFWLAQIGAI